MYLRLDDKELSFFSELAATASILNKKGTINKYSIAVAIAELALPLNVPNIVPITSIVQFVSELRTGFEAMVLRRDVFRQIFAKLKM